MGKASWLVVLCMVTGCGLSSARDGGMGGSGGGTSAVGGGSGTGGGTNNGGGSATGGGSGTGGGVSTGGGSGGSGGGTAANLQYASLALLTTTGTTVVAVSGRAGEIYLVTDASTGNLYRSSGGSFTEVTGSGLSSGRGLYVASDGSVFPGGSKQLGSCRANCSTGASYTMVAMGSGDDVYSICGDSPTNVYGIIEDQSFNGVLWHYDGNGWTKVVNNLGIKNPHGCAMLPDHTVVIAGQKEIAFHLNGQTTKEAAALSPPLTTQNDADYTQWYGVGTVGAKVYVGGASRRISVRSAPNTWTMTLTPSVSDTLYAMAGTGDAEVFAGGGFNTNTALRIFNGTSWVDGPALTTVKNVRSIFVLSPNEIYFAGADNSGDPAIDKAFR